MGKTKGLHAPSSVALSYQLIRNTTSPDEQTSGVKSFVVNLPAFEILKLDTKENLRAYIPAYNPKKRNRVHDAIQSTIAQSPERFITRNSGFVITATGIEVDDNAKVVKLTSASVINGAQSQGEVRQFIEAQFAEPEKRDNQNPPFYVRAEIIVDDDEEEITETAIARNTATPVKSISEAGARHQLDDLAESVKRVFPRIQIQIRETDEGAFDTRKLLQYTRLLMPLSVSKNSSPAERLRPYKNPAQCLTEFTQWYEARATNEEARAKYDFTVQMAPVAISEYTYWENHDAWNGHRLWEQTAKGGRACRRADGRIVWVSPGILFPLLGAISEFAVKDKQGVWTLRKPNFFRPEEMIKQAVSQFRAHSSDPMHMGRSEAAYSALQIYPQTLVSVIDDIAHESR
jgi:hypothetical protein